MFLEDRKSGEDAVKYWEKVIEEQQEREKWAICWIIFNMCFIFLLYYMDSNHPMLIFWTGVGVGLLAVVALVVFDYMDRLLKVSVARVKRIDATIARTKRKIQENDIKLQQIRQELKELEERKSLPFDNGNV